MKLSDIILPIPIDNARELALIFTPELAKRLAELHSQYGSPNCIPIPTKLIDGKLMLCADILTEIMPGGLLHQMWEMADKSIILNNVEVIPMSEALSMIVKEI